MKKYFSKKEKIQEKKKFQKNKAQNWNLEKKRRTTRKIEERERESEGEKEEKAVPSILFTSFFLMQYLYLCRLPRSPILFPDLSLFSFPFSLPTPLSPFPHLYIVICIVRLYINI